MRPFITLSLAAVLLSGCAAAPLEQPQIATPAAFAAPQSTQTAQPVDTWWLVFQDEALNGLMARAMAGNLDLRIAHGRLAQAHALMGQARAGLWPQLGIGYSANHGADPGQGKPSTLHASGAELSYEIDLFGRLGKAAQAAQFDAQASQALLRDTQLLIQARVAESYITLRTLDEDRAILRETLDAYRGSLKVTQRRFEEGDVAELDVARLQAEVASTQAQAAALDQQRAQAAHALAVLLGEPASGFELAAAPWSAQPWSGAVPMIPAGLPADLLQRRPDIRAAEANLYAAQRRVGIAKAAWFPTLSLTADGGYASGDLDSLFEDVAKNWSLTGILSQAIFDGGRRASGIDYAQGGLDIAFASYQQTALIAFADVENQLSDLAWLREQQTAQDQAVEAANRALRMSQSRYTNGGASQLEVLDAQRQLLTIRRQALRVRSAQYQSTIGLMRAIGGAWGKA